MTVGDLAPLRAAGLSDGGIHDATAIVAYFNFVNRLAEGPYPGDSPLSTRMAQPRIVVFDVNQALLDVSAGGRSSSARSGAAAYCPSGFRCCCNTRRR